MGYFRAGFQIVGVDIAPQPSYPFEFHLGNALEFPLNGFDIVHASPPCQRFSRISRYQRISEQYEDLIMATRERLAAFGKPWVIENVPEAPLRRDLMLCGQMFGLPILRHRVFECEGWCPSHPSHPSHPGRQAWSGYNRLPEILTIVGHTYRLEEGRYAMGIPWMASREELNEAIPPAYTEWIGKQLVEATGESSR